MWVGEALFVGGREGGCVFVLTSGCFETLHTTIVYEITERNPIQLINGREKTFYDDLFTMKKRARINML